MPPDFPLNHLIASQGLTKDYDRGGLLSKRIAARALDHVDFRVEQGSVTALVGASGSGKSTLLRCIAGLEKPTRGVISYRGADIWRMAKARMLRYRRTVQMVFQEPAGSINPRFTAACAVCEPLKIAAIGNRGERLERAVYWMEQVGLPAAYAARPALQLSGGERQRLAIARALISNPEVIIFDEPFSALDLPVASRILTLLARLQGLRNLTYVFAGHDLALLARICSEIAVLYDGRVVERQATPDFLRAPRHAYSRELVRAMPRAPAGWPA